jgi:hypothetical protein
MGPEWALYVERRVEAAVSYSMSSPDLVPTTTWARELNQRVGEMRSSREGITETETGK